MAYSRTSRLQTKQSRRSRLSPGQAGFSARIHESLRQIAEGDRISISNLVNFSHHPAIIDPRMEEGNSPTPVSARPAPGVIVSSIPKNKKCRDEAAAKGSRSAIP
jgi:hypothetical protein